MASGSGGLDAVRGRHQTLNRPVHGHEHHRPARLLQPLGGTGQLAQAGTDLLHHRQIAQGDGTARDAAVHTLARESLEVSRFLEHRAPRLGAGEDRRRQRVLRPAFEGSGEGEDLASSMRPPAAAITSVNSGLPSVRVPVLSTISTSTFAQPLKRRRIPHQHARLGATPG